MYRLACMIGLLTLLSAVPIQAAAPAVSAISKEPLYAGIVKRAGQLKARTDSLAAKASPALLASKAFAAYVTDIKALSDSDLKGHYDLRTRGTDSDLKCILMGVSRDLNLKLDAIHAARTDAEVKASLQDMSDLLSDNIDVIVTPATADSGLDCVIEFGKGA